MHIRVSKKYAQALFTLSCEQRVKDAVLNDLTSLSALIDESAEFADFISHPVIPADRRLKIIQLLFKTNLHELTYRFLCFLNEKIRMYLLRDICAFVVKLDDKYLGNRRMCLTSNANLETQQVKSIVKHFNKRLGVHVIPTVVTDPQILGGITIRDGNTIYDFSLKSQLEQFRANLLKA